MLSRFRKETKDAPKTLKFQGCRTREWNVTPAEPVTFLELHVLEERHEAEIHMQLLMAVKQREPRIIRHEIDLHLLIPANHDHVLDDSRGRLPCHTCQLKTVAVKVDRMDVIARVPHPQPIPFPLLQLKQ